MHQVHELTSRPLSAQGFEIERKNVAPRAISPKNKSPIPIVNSFQNNLIPQRKIAKSSMRTTNRIPPNPAKKIDKHKIRNKSINIS
jgi:hypothetical protein